MIGAVAVFLGAEAKAALDFAFSLHTAEELRNLAKNAGLEDVRVRFEHRTLRFPVAADLVKGYMGITPVTPQFLALTDDRKQAFVAHVVRELASYMDDAGLAVPAENHFLTALKPARPEN